MSFGRSIASREWNVYAERAWQNYCRGEKSEAKNEDNKQTTKIDPCAIAQRVRRKDKLVHVVIGHIPREISRFTKLFLHYGGTVETKVFSS